MECGNPRNLEVTQSFHYFSLCMPLRTYFVVLWHLYGREEIITFRPFILIKMNFEWCICNLNNIITFTIHSQVFKIEQLAIFLNNVFILCEVEAYNYSQWSTVRWIIFSRVVIVKCILFPYKVFFPSFWGLHQTK